MDEIYNYIIFSQEDPPDHQLSFKWSTVHTAFLKVGEKWKNVQFWRNVKLLKHLKKFFEKFFENVRKITIKSFTFRQNCTFFHFSPTFRNAIWTVDHLNESWWSGGSSCEKIRLEGALVIFPDQSAGLSAVQLSSA